MFQPDHNPSAPRDAGRADVPRRDLSHALVASRRCQRRRLRSREATRARVRVGLVVALASLLLLVVIAQWSAHVLHLDLAAVLKPTLIVVGVAAVVYLLALITVASIVQRRRHATAPGGTEAANRAA